MNRLSVIIPVYNGEKYIKQTLESMVTQTVENFDVIIVDDGSVDGTAEICKKYCDEYNGFYYIRTEHNGVYAARNKGIENSKCEYLLFLDCGDVLTDGSVEAILNCADSNDADIVTGRCWRNGDIEYEYDKALDIIATMPEVEKMESWLFKNSELGAKAFHKKVFDLYNIRFFDLSAYGELLFMMQIVMQGVKISGCPDFILEKTVKHIEDGYSVFQMPSEENLKSAAFVFNELFEMGKSAIIEKTGSFDGDEAYIQEIIYYIYQFYLDNFYRKYWYMDAKTLSLMKDEFEKYAKSVRPERFKKLNDNNSDLRLPYIYTDKAEAASEPEFSLLFDLPKESEYLYFLRSLYAQSYPFFELIVSESRYNSSSFPDEFKRMENIVVLPDKNFHTVARQTAKSRKCIDIRSSEPLDMRVLKEMAHSKAPAFTAQYVFGQKRKTLALRKTLKDKGLNMN